jgi:hypothetical protein
MDLAKLDFEVLKEMAKELNKATYDKDGAATLFLAKKLKTIAVTKELLATAFDAAIQGIVEAELADKLPEEIIDYYNENFVDEEGAEAEKAAEPAPAKEKTTAKAPVKEKAAAAPKAEKPAKEKKVKAAVELSCFGHKIGSQAAALDDLLAPGKPISLEELSKKSGRSLLGVKSHIKHLQDARKLVIESKDGTYTFKPAKK